MRDDSDKLASIHDISLSYHYKLLYHSTSAQCAVGRKVKRRVEICFINTCGAQASSAGHSDRTLTLWYSVLLFD